MAPSACMSDTKCSRPELRLVVTSCCAQGSGDIILTFYNDIETMRRKIDLYAWFILNDILKTSDITAVIVGYMRDQPRLNELAMLRSGIFENTSKMMFNAMSILVLKSIALNEGPAPHFLIDYTQVHLAKKDRERIHPLTEEIKTMIFAILNKETTTITYKLKSNNTNKVTGLIIHIVLTLLMTFPLLHIDIQSHHRQSFFDTCLAVLVEYNGPHKLISKLLFTLCLNDFASLSVADCHCCVEPEITPSLSCTIQ